MINTFILSSTEWTEILIPQGSFFLLPQSQGGFYISSTPKTDMTQVDDADVHSISDFISGIAETDKTFWVLASRDGFQLGYTDEYVRSGGSGGGNGGTTVPKLVFKDGLFEANNEVSLKVNPTSKALSITPDGLTFESNKDDYIVEAHTLAEGLNEIYKNTIAFSGSSPIKVTGDLTRSTKGFKFDIEYDKDSGLFTKDINGTKSLSLDISKHTDLKDLVSKVEGNTATIESITKGLEPLKDVAYLSKENTFTKGNTFDSGLTINGSITGDFKLDTAKTIISKSLLQYETELDPKADGKNLVPYFILKQVEDKLLAMIESLTNSLEFIGVIQETAESVTNNNTLLAEFVKKEAKREKRQGDFIKTSDDYGFIYSGKAWVNFGKVTINIASTSKAGIIQLGTNEGELEAVNNTAVVRVVGFDSLKNKVLDIEAKITNLESLKQEVTKNTQSIEEINNTLKDVVFITKDQSIDGNKTFLNPITIQAPTEDTHATTKKYVDDAIKTNLNFTAPLKNTDGTITLELKQDGGLKVIDDTLAIDANSPIILELKEGNETALNEIFVNRQHITEITQKIGELEGFRETLKVTNPLSMKDGTISLVIGEGLTIDDKGTLAFDGDFTLINDIGNKLNDVENKTTELKLEVDKLNEFNSKLGATSPLVFKDGKFSITIGQGLKVDNNALIIDANSEVITEIRETAENALNETQVNKQHITEIINKIGSIEDFKDNLKVTEPLLNTDGTISLVLGNGLVVDNKALTLDNEIINKLNLVDNKADENRLSIEALNSFKESLSTTAPLVMKDGNISITIGQGLKVDKDTLIIDTNSEVISSLRENTETALNEIFVNRQHITEITQKVGELESFSSSLNVSEPLVMKDGNISLTIGEGLKVDKGALLFDTEALDELTKAVTLVDNKADENRLDIESLKTFTKSLNVTEPLTLENGTIAITIGSGLKVDNKAIAFDSTITDSLKTEIETLKKHDTYIGEAIENNHNLILHTTAQLQSQINSLIGSIEFIGVIDKTEAEVKDDTSLLDKFVEDKVSREKREGDFIKTNDGTGFIYNGTEWVNFGKTDIAIASVDKAGIIKLGTKLGELEDTGDGLVKVVGIDELKETSDNALNETQVNKQHINEIIKKVGELESFNSSINTDKPLNMKDGKITLSLGDGLTIDSNEALALSPEIGNKLNDVENKTIELKANIDSLNEFKESLKVVEPITMTDGEIKLSIGDGLKVEADKLVVNAGSKVITELKNATDDALNEIFVNRQHINEIISEVGKLGEFTSSLSAETPITLVDGNIKLAYGEGLKIADNKLVFDSNKVDAEITKLKDKDVEQDNKIAQLEAKTIKVTAPITNTNETIGLELKADGGLKVDGTGLAIDATSTIIVELKENTETALNEIFVNRQHITEITQKIGELEGFRENLKVTTPLVFKDDTIELKYGSGLKVENETLVFDSTETDKKFAELGAKVDKNTSDITKLQEDDVKIGEAIKNIKTNADKLQGQIDSLMNAIEFIGVIDKTETEVEANNELLNTFVKTEVQREKRKGDFIKTKDGVGYIYNGTKWINFGKTDIAIATTDKAGLVKLGTANGELQDKGNGLVEVIGFTELSTKVDTNTNKITELENFKTSLKATAPITMTDGTIALTIGDGLKIEGDALVVNSASTIISDITNKVDAVTKQAETNKTDIEGLKNADKEINDKIKALENFKTSLNATTPLTLVDGKISINLGDGLKVENDKLVVASDSTIISNIKTELDKVKDQANTNKNDISNLKDKDTELETMIKGLESFKDNLKVTEPLTMSKDGQISLSIGDGLKVENKTLVVTNDSTIIKELETKITNNTTLITTTKDSLQAQIDSLKNVIEFIGEIQKTEEEVKDNETLLTEFVKTTANREPRKGDFVKTTDGTGFIFNGTAWLNFGKTTINIATTAKAGIVKLGSNEGELQDKGEGVVEVIGYSTLKTQVEANKTDIANLKTDASKYVTLADAQSISGEKTFTTLPKSTIEATEEQHLTTKKYVDDAIKNAKPEELKFSSPLKNENGTISIGIKTDGGLKVDNNELSVDFTQGSLKDELDGVVKIEGDQTIKGNKTFENPVSVADATEAQHAVNKKQLDAIPKYTFDPNYFYVDENNFVTLAPIAPIKYKPTKPEQLRKLVETLSVNLNDVDIELITDLSYIFAKHYKKEGFAELKRTDYSGVENWNTSKVTTIEALCFDNELFNHNIESWDMSKVTNMACAFKDALTFNQPLNNWDVSKVETCASMFAITKEIPSDKKKPKTREELRKLVEDVSVDLSKVDTSEVTDFSRLFEHSAGYELNRTDYSGIETWTTTQVTNFNQLCLGNEKFNHDISSWNTENVTDMSKAFKGATTFDKPLNTWKTDKVTTMASMFEGATIFNQELSNWKTTSLTDMSCMFKDALAFDKSINDWDVSKVSSSSSMFEITKK